jgi:uncharacterized protein (TIGR03437 family)
MNVRTLAVPVVTLAAFLNAFGSTHKPRNLEASLPLPLGKLPLAFEQNRGQAADKVRFLARGAGYILYLTAGESLLSLDRPGTQEATVFRSKLVGANPRCRIQGEASLPGKSNYFLGADRQHWITDVPTYAEVRYREVYRGIDLVYYGKQGKLEFDFIVSPGVSPDAIQLVFEGATKTRVDRNGDLLLDAGPTRLRWRRPVAYQIANGERKPVEGAFVVKGGRRIGFRVPHYDPSLPLVIDPVLSYSTLYGGSGNEAARGLAVDSSGNVYFAGYTTSTNLPGTASGFQPKYGGHENTFVTGDALVAKLNPAGTALVYSTYLGGSASDLGLALAVDSSGNAYVTGYTRSANFPTTTGAFQRTYQGAGGNTWNLGGDAFVTKLNAAGNGLVYSTYLGGEMDDRGSAITVDSAGNAYVAGMTMSRKFPVTDGAFQRTYGGEGGMPVHPMVGKAVMLFGDAFVAKLNPAGSALSFCTYLGGNQEDAATSIAVDSSGFVYVAGGTLSPNFPVTTGVVQTKFAGYGTPGKDIFRLGDGFVAKLRPDGSALVQSTFLGGSRDDSILGLALDSSGNIYVAGFTVSTDFPITTGAYQTAYRGNTPSTVNELIYGDAFVTKLNPTMSTLVYSTYLGGTQDDAVWSIAVDLGGNAFVAGTTQSRDFPVSADALQATFGGEGGEPGIQAFGDAFVAGLSANGQKLVYSTYLGGRDADGAAAIVLDNAGNGYVAGVTFSSNFTTTAGAFQRTMAGGDYNVGYPPGDVFVAKFASLFQPPMITVSAASFILGAALAADSLVTGYGQGLASATEVATSQPLPTTLGGTSIKVKDSGGTERLAALWFASPGQINYLVPTGTATGLASVTVVNQAQTVATGTLQIDSVAPGLFAANANGQGVPAAYVIRVVYPTQGDPTVTREAPFQCGTTAGSCVPKPVDFVAANNDLYLELYGTGIRGRSSLAAAAVKIGGVDTPVLYAGPVEGMPGLDQVNVGVPRSLIGRGNVDIVLTVDGKTANTVVVNIK